MSDPNSTHIFIILESILEKFWARSRIMTDPFHMFSERFTNDVLKFYTYATVSRQFTARTSMRLY